jgi:glucose/mannose-6-phosphate isomerase
VSRLDEADITDLDKEQMLARTGELGTELVRAWDAAEDLALPAGAEGAANVVVAGMGGSATAADYFVALCGESAEIPVSVVRGYTLPNYVAEHSLVVVSSFSGNTEESLSCYDDAWKRGASIIVLTTGGQLAERAASDGAAIWLIHYRSQPRAAIAHGLGPLLRLGVSLGLCSVDRGELEAVARLHGNFVSQLVGPAVPAVQNGAKQLAEALHGRIPLVIGAEHLAPVASRFKNQVAENGKALGAADILPEADHNLVVGLATGEQAAKCLSLVTLESAIYHERTQRRFDVTTQLFEETGIPVHRLQVVGSRVLEQLFIGTAWGDYVSCYLAFLNGQDPSPVPQIDRLKAALSG